MKILIIGEESQVICIQCRKLGHEAYSCDIKECSGGHPEWHYKGDWFGYIRMGWDMIIGHPVCTKVCVSGNRTYAKGKPKYNERLESAKYIEELWNDCISVCDRVCFENPVGVLPTLTNMPKPHYIQPWQFGHTETKRTGLWLHGLPELNPTNIVKPEYIYYKSKKTKSGYSKYSAGQGDKPSTNNPENARLRSKTYSGIAKAMAEQWTITN